MADEADRAQPHIDAAIEDAVAKARTVVDNLPPIHQCHACAAPVQGRALFCDDECREDWHYFASRDRINRGRR